MSDKFLLYGVTGYTGALIARIALEQGLTPVIAGRNKEKLQAIADPMGVDFRTFSLDNPMAVDEALADIQVVLNCAGPFSITAHYLAEGCVRTHTHYLDIAGEVPEFEAMWRRDEQAKEADVLLLPGVGFGVVPTDCLALHLKNQLPSATELVLAFETVGGASQGTLSVVLKDLHKVGVVRQKGKLIDARPAAKQRRIDFGQGDVKTVLNPWRGDLFTAYHSTGIDTIETFSAFPAPLPTVMAAERYLGWLWNSSPFQGMLTSLIRRLPAGPTEEQLQTGLTRVWGEVTDTAGQKASARLIGPEAYIFTALTAAAIVKRVLAGDLSPGFQTPAQLYGADFILQIDGVTREDLS
ncbi:MAG: saccharopine dehydrogenase NADP-binding domain-containing protein [Chloroflexota bacterium]